MKKTITTFFILFFAFSYAQSLHIKYDYKVSDISSMTEDLYLLKDKSVSVKDSIVSFNHQNTNPQGTIHLKEAIYKERFEKGLSEDKVGVYVYENDQPYYIQDRIPKLAWKIDEDMQKNILGYTCYQATAMFRGSTIVAYFTKEIPYSVGPYKFSGLPGAILEIGEKGKNYNSWVATEVNLNHVKELPYFNKKEYQPITLKEFVEMKEEKMNKLFNKMTISASSAIKIERTKNRYGIEKVYEWE